MAKSRKGLEEELAQSQENLNLVTEEYDKLEETQYRAQKLLEKAAAEKETLIGVVQGAEEKLKTYQAQAFDSMRTLVMTRNQLSGVRQEVLLCPLYRRGGRDIFPGIRGQMRPRQQLWLSLFPERILPGQSVSKGNIGWP